MSRAAREALLPGCAKCHKTLNSHMRPVPQNPARGAVPCGQGWQCPQGWVPVSQQPSCRAARCAPAVRCYSLLSELSSGGAPAPPTHPAPRATPELAGGTTVVCKGADGNNYPCANSMEISMCLGKRQPSPSAARGRGLLLFPGTVTKSAVCYMDGV